jgi:hypothetical protein
MTVFVGKMVVAVAMMVVAVSSETQQKVYTYYRLCVNVSEDRTASIIRAMNWRQDVPLKC